MGRAEDRKKKKFMKKRLTNEQLGRLQSETNLEYINLEVEKKCDFFKNLFSDCIIEAFKKNGFSNIQANKLLDDVEIIMKKKVAKSNEQSKKTIS